MTFGDSIRTVLTKYADFTGRAGRPEFWWFALFNFLVSVILSGSSNALNTVDSLTSASQPGSQLVEPLRLFGAALASLTWIYGAAVLLPTLAVTVRRLRDANYGWGNLFWLLLPVAGAIVLLVLLCQPSQTPARYPGSAWAAGAAPAGGPAPRTAAAGWAPAAGVAPPANAPYGCVTSMRTLPGCRDAVVRILVESAHQLPPLGCRRYDVSVSNTDADLIWVSEIWWSRDAHEASLQTPEVRSAIASAAPMLAGAPNRAETTVIGGLGV